MGMGSIPCKATVINVDFLTKLPTAGPILSRVLEYLSDHDICESCLDCENGDVYWEVGGWEGDEDEGKEHEEWIAGQMMSFHEAFESDTGLRCYPFYYNDDDGDRYDDLDEGLYWSVDGVYEMTPEAKRIKDALTDVMWTVYG